MDHRVFTSWRKHCCVHTDLVSRVFVVLASLVQIVLAQYYTLAPLSPSAKLRLLYGAVKILTPVEKELFGSLSSYRPIEEKSMRS